MDRGRTSTAFAGVSWHVAILAALVAALVALLAVSVAPAAAAPKPKPQCADKIDNDGDGLVDSGRRGDPDCADRKGTIEGPTLNCGDADGDGIRTDPPSLPNASVTCVNGVAHIASCNPNFWDINSIAGDGCEYGPIQNTGPETCDGIDNDADGQVDEGVVMPVVSNGTLVCTNGSAQLICAFGFAPVSGDPLDGCENAIADSLRF
jgi:hypothetical protein